MLTRLAALTAAVAFALAGILFAFQAGAAAAHSDRWEVNSHGVVLHSELPHCTVEDGSSGPLPCTWNIGDKVDGNGVGLSYKVGAQGKFHYVWNTSPVKDHAHRHWISSELEDVLCEGFSANWDHAYAKFRHGSPRLIVFPNGRRIHI